MTADIRIYALPIFRAWLEERYGRSFAMEVAAVSEGAEAELTSEGIRVAAVTSDMTVQGDAPPSWREGQESLEAALAGATKGGFVLWAPPGAALPEDDERARFVQRVAAAAMALGPGERSAVEFPVALELRRLEDDGGLINVSGGMAQLWAQFTGRVSGTYRLNSNALHRLPEDAAYRDALMKTIVERANEMGTVGDRVSIEAIDAWTVQRLPEGAANGFAVVALAPSPEPNSGAQIRRDLRRALREAQLRLGGAGIRDTMRALVLVAAFRTAEEENISLALRGFDPTIYAAIDFIVLLTDGRVRPLYISPRTPV